MPVIPIPPAIFATAPPKTLPPQPAPDLLITARRQSIDAEHQTLIYSEGVVVTYSPTIIIADRVELHNSPGEEYGIATGHVKLTDPAGTVTADRILFHYKAGTGEGDNVDVSAEGFQVWAGHIDIQPERRISVVDRSGAPQVRTTPATWTLTNVSATGCTRPLPSYLIRSSKVVIQPGHFGTAYHPDFYVLGHKIVRLPTQRFSLDRRNQGIGLPTLSLNRDWHIGAVWMGGLLLDDRTAFNFRTSSFPGRPVTGRVSIARSFVPASQNPAPLVPMSEFSERFSSGYFDNIRTRSFESEEANSRRPQNLISASSFLRVTPSARLTSEHFNVPLELTAQRAGSIGGWGLLGVARADALQSAGRSMNYRLNEQIAVSPPRLPIGPGIFGIARLDGAHFLGSTSYGWVRGQAGLLYEPLKWLSLGGVYFSGKDFGRPQFDMDRLVAGRGLEGRVDLNLGSTHVGYLLKYDPAKRAVFDREYTITQAVGCVEFFLDYRKFPNHYALGIVLRTDQFFDRLRQRSIQRARDIKASTGIGR